MSKKSKKKHLIRLAVQIFFLALIILISVNYFRSEQGLPPLLIGAPSLHAVCPFGGVVTIYTYFTQGTFIQKIYQSSITLMWLVLGLTLLFGPVFCGWICPFGNADYFISKIGKILFSTIQFNLPEFVDKPLRYAKYIF